MHSFNGPTGPVGSLILSGTTLYGMTPTGGPYEDGDIFSIGITGNGYKDLLDFSGSNGSDPMGDLTINASTLYGMTYSGGQYGEGTVFALNLVPEPSSLILLVAGAIGLAGYGWRRKLAGQA